MSERMRQRINWLIKTIRCLRYGRKRVAIEWLQSLPKVKCVIGARLLIGWLNCSSNDILLRENGRDTIGLLKSEPKERKVSDDGRILTFWLKFDPKNNWVSLGGR